MTLRAGAIMLDTVAISPIAQAVVLIGGKRHKLELGAGVWRFGVIFLPTVAYRFENTQTGGLLLKVGTTFGMMGVPIPYIGAGYSFPHRK